MTDQMVFGVMNPFLRNDQKTALHLGNADIFPPADLASVLGKPSSEIALSRRFADVNQLPLRVRCHAH
jgi:hypothetical protein